jgi:hypothetical protein
MLLEKLTLILFPLLSLLCLFECIFFLFFLSFNFHSVILFLAFFVVFYTLFRLFCWLMYIVFRFRKSWLGFLLLDLVFWVFFFRSVCFNSPSHREFFRRLCSNCFFFFFFFSISILFCHNQKSTILYPCFHFSSETEFSYIVLEITSQSYA